MRPRPSLLRLLALALVAAGFITSIEVAASVRHIPPRSPDVTLWVMQPPGEVVAFDLADFLRVGGVRVPPVAFNDPGRLSINGLGQMLVQLDADLLWLWDGDGAKTIPITPDLSGMASPPSNSSTPMPQWLLGDDGKSLYVLQSKSRQVGTSTADSASSSHVVVRTSLALQPRDPILSILRKPCQKQYGFPADGAEPCPDPDIWAPGGVVRTYFVLTHWEQDSQTDPEAQPYGSRHRTLYRRGIKGWRASDLGTSEHQPLLDVSSDGTAWVQTEEDGGCCGSSNGGSDRAVFGSADTALVLFDEWPRFHNQNYDMSFYTDKARIAPGGGRVAFTIHATEAPGAAIPVSADGHPDTLELASIQRSLADLPIVEIHAMGPKPTHLLRLRHVELVGWASDSELLVVERGHVVGVDVITKRRRESGIGVRTAEDASVVWK